MLLLIITYKAILVSAYTNTYFDSIVYILGMEIIVNNVKIFKYIKIHLTDYNYIAQNCKIANSNYSTTG